MSLFKSIIVYRIGTGWTPPTQEILESALKSQPFVACGPTQSESSGWVPPRGEENAALSEHIAGQLILKLEVERKSVPAGAVNAELEIRCKARQEQTGRKVGRKEKNELKEDITVEFMPRAFSKHSAHLAWIDPVNRFLVVGAGSNKAADQVVSAIVDVMAEAGQVLPIALLSPVMQPSAAMALWLGTKEGPGGFTVDRDVELKMPDDEKSTVRYVRHNLELDEIVQHIAEGKVPTQLALTWESQVSFVLTDALTLRKIDILKADTSVGEEDSGFDGDVVIATGELSKLLPALLEALGGETPQEEQAPANTLEAIA
jgi:recombination associated protein RdgC